MSKVRRTAINPVRIQPAPMGASSNRPLAETVATWLLAVAAVVAPLVLGASGPWASLALATTCVIAICLWTLSGQRPNALIATPVLITGLLCMQLIPLPDPLLVRIAPVSAGAWKVAQEGLDTWGRVSIDPHATRVGLRRTILGLATAGVVIGLSRFQSQRRVLILGIALSGITILGTAYVFQQTGEKHRVLGFIDICGPITPNSNPISAPVQTSGVGMTEWVVVGERRYQMDAGNLGNSTGSYLYANHFAGGVCLTLPALVSAWLWITLARLPPAARWAGAAGLWAVGIWAVFYLAQSRAGTLALVVSLFVLIATATKNVWMQRIATAFALLGLTAAFSYLLVVLGPLAWLSNLLPANLEIIEPLLSDARTISARVAMRAFWASPILGTGLGTYGDIYPRFYHDKFVLFYAHNDYAQLLAETGLTGAVLVTVLAVLLGMKAKRFIQAATGQYRTLNAGLWAAVAGIAIHSAFDWNLHLPANAFLAILAGALAFSSVPAFGIPSRLSRLAGFVPEAIPRLLLTGACVAILPYLVRDSFSEAAQSGLRAAIVADRVHAAEPSKNLAAGERLAEAIMVGERCARWDSTNPTLLLLLGQARLHMARTIPDPAKREDVLGAAEMCFRKASLACASRRGLAENLIPQTKSR